MLKESLHSSMLHLMMVVLSALHSEAHADKVKATPPTVKATPPSVKATSSAVETTSPGPFVEMRLNPQWQQGHSINFAQDIKIGKLDDGVSMENPRYDIQIVDIYLNSNVIKHMKSNVVKIIKPSMIFLADRIAYTKGWVLSGECKNVRIIWNPGDIELALPSKLEVALKSLPTKKSTDPDYSLPATWQLKINEIAPRTKDPKNPNFGRNHRQAIKDWLVENLQSHTKAETLNKTLSFSGECKGYSNQIEATLRNIVSHLGTDESLDPMLEKAVTSIEADLEKQFNEQMRARMGPWILAASKEEFHLVTKFGPKEWVVTMGRGAADPLTEHLTEKYSGNRPQELVSIAANQEFLNLALANYFVQKEKDLHFTFTPEVQVKDLRGEVPEVDEVLAQDDKFMLHFKTLRCPEIVPPRARPWISSSGLAHGIETYFHFEVQLRDINNTFITSRKVSLVSRFQLKKIVGKEKSRGEIVYVGGAWLWNSPDTEACDLKRLPSTIGLSVDWALDSKRFIEQIQQEIEEKLPPELTVKSSIWNYYTLGTSSFKNRRKIGGYYGRAVIVQTESLGAPLGSNF